MEHEIRGFYGKYRATKRGGDKELDGPYFVLRYDRDPHAYVALKSYADSVRGENPILAQDLDNELRRWQSAYDAIRFARSEE